MENMTMDVLIAIVQSNLAAHIGEQIDPDKIKSICTNIRDCLEHHKED